MEFYTCSKCNRINKTDIRPPTIAHEYGIGNTCPDCASKDKPKDRKRAPHIKGE